ncbi:MAG: sterol desaturase family protein [Myxococcota bacterium]
MSGTDKRTRPTTCRMFDTPLIEFFSRIHPLSPFAFWVPTLGLLSAYVLYRGMSAALLVALAAAGWLAWSLVEYLLHRYVFHYVKPRPWQRRFHFIAHGVHHDFPQDAARLVMPLGVSIPLGLAFFLVALALFPLDITIALMVGFGGGYLLYDAIHYATHHLRPRTRLGKYLKKYHMVHHTGVEGLWGVSQPLWDFVLGTYLDLDGRPPGTKPVPDRPRSASAAPATPAEASR